MSENRLLLMGIRRTRLEGIATPTSAYLVTPILGYLHDLLSPCSDLARSTSLVMVLALTI